MRLGFVCLNLAVLCASASATNLWPGVRACVSETARGVVPVSVTRIPWQRRERAAYLEQIAPRVRANPSPYTGLPLGIPAEHEEAFRVLFSFLKHDTEVFDELQALEAEVLEYSQQRIRSRFPAFFFEYLREREAQCGFGTIHRERGFLTRDAFMGLLFTGRPIVDFFFRNQPHTIHGHRVMSVIAARRLTRAGFPITKYAELYRVMGSPEVLRALRWDDTGIDVSRIDYARVETIPDLFGYFHDSSFFTPDHFSILAQDFTNPLFLSQLRRFLPGLAAWD